MTMTMTKVINMSSTTSSNVSIIDNDHLLAIINQEKSLLLSPVIIYTILAMIVGTVGNPIAIYIYGWKWPKSTTRVFLFWLACVDLLNCLITMPTEIYFLSYFYYQPNGSFCRLSRFFTYFINNSTSAIFLAIALDRYIRICHPHQSPLSILGAKVACGLSLLVGGGVSWPAFILYGRKIVHIPSKDAENGYIRGVMCSVKNEMDKTPYPFAFFIYLCCGVGMCFFVLSVFYILIGRVILKRRRARDKRRQGQQSERETLQKKKTRNGSDDAPYPEVADEKPSNVVSVSSDHRNSDVNNCLNIGPHVNGCADIVPVLRNGKRIGVPPRSTLMLGAITAVFVASFLPFLIIMIIRQHIGPSFYPLLSAPMEVVVNILSRSYLVNNCANPIVYGLCNTKFNDEVRKLFRLSRHRRNSSLSRNESNGTARESYHQQQ